MYTRHFFVFLSAIIIIFSVLSAPNISFAETRVVSTDLAYLFSASGATSTIIWDKKGSPYILEETVTVPDHVILVLDEGVEVTASSTLEYEPHIIVQGVFAVRGSLGDPVILRDFGGVVASLGNISIHEGRLSGMKSAISAMGSIVDIRDSEIIDNYIGVESNPRVFLAEAYLSSGIGGIGNVFTDENQEENRITIRNTYFSGNRGYDIYNRTMNMVDARQNWWEQYPGKIVGLVDDSDPNVFDKSEECCSSVLFLPGIQASRLYIDEGVLSDSRNRLWEPNRNDDVRKLYRVASTGVDSKTGIYTKDIIDDAFGYGIYGKFMSMMDRDVEHGTLSEWKAYPYDWRDSVGDIARSDGLMNVFISLASTSRTGKVTIVAHSNGGLLTKAFGRVLEKRGLVNLVDKVVFVAVPQLGTPQAIGALLHGDNQSILGGLILSAGVARHLGLSIAGSYGLIPSNRFFTDEWGVNDAIGNIVSFTTGKIAGFDFSQYGSGISSSGDLKDFLVARHDDRSQPAEDAVAAPAILDQNLLSSADRLHDDIDDWHFASTTEVYSFAGWGVPTLSSLRYVERNTCIIGGCVDHLSIVPEDSILGDGTVLTRSASSYESVVPSSRFAFVNLGKDHEDAVHSNILGSTGVLNALSMIMSTSSSRALASSVYAIPNISERIPEEYTRVKSLRISVHSPVDLHVYDVDGNHTGPAKNPIPDSDFYFIEQEIPGSKYSFFGEDKYVTISGISSDAGSASSPETYVVNVRGIGEGSFTLITEQFAGDILVASSSFENIPVNIGTSATTSVTVGVSEDVGRSIEMSDLEIMSSPSGSEADSRITIRSKSSRQHEIRASTSQPAASDESTSFDMETHIDRIVDLMKRNRLFLKSLSGPDRAVLLDLLEIL